MIAAKNAKVVKADWKTVKLGEISVDGGHYGIGAPAVEYDERLPTYLRITDIRDDGSICKEGLKSVDSEDAEEYYLKPNDLVIARTGASTGRNYFYDGRDGDFVYAGFLIKFSIDENKIWPPYVKYWFKGDEYRSWLNNHTDGSTRANINAVTLAECPIRVPESLPTQRKIAAVLGALDDKIENNRKICANLEAQAQALFKSWFVDFEPWGGEMPKDWKMGSLYEFADIIYGAPFKSKLFNEKGDGRPIIRIRDLKNNETKTYTTECHDKEYVVQAGDLVVGMDGEFRLYVWGNKPALLNQRVCVFKPKDKVSTAYLLFSIKPQLEFVEATEAATTVIHIGKEDFDSFKISIPSKDWLSKFNGIAQKQIDLSTRLRQYNVALAELRDALLPKLMSGELDVDDVEV